MDKKIIAAALGVILVSAFLLLQNGEEVTAPQNESTSSPLKAVSKSASAPKELVIEKPKTHTVQSKEKTTTQNESAKTDTTSKTVTAQKNKTPQKSAKPANISPQKAKVAQFKHKLLKNGFKPLKINKTTTVYYKNPPKKQNSFIPPALPTIINIKEGDKKIPVVVDTNILQNNEKIYVQKDDNIYEVDSQNPQESKPVIQNDQNDQQDEEIELIAPPSIGQN